MLSRKEGMRSTKEKEEEGMIDMMEEEGIEMKEKIEEEVTEGGPIKTMMILIPKRTMTDNLFLMMISSEL